MSDNLNENHKAEDNSIDLLKEARFIWSKRKFIIKICLVFAVCGVIVGYSIPKEYKAQIKIASESSSAYRNSGALGGLAAMAGVNINQQQSGGDAIMPTLYPDVVASTPFLVELLDVEVESSDSRYKGTLAEYMAKHQRSPWWRYITGAPGKLWGWVRSGFRTATPEGPHQNNEINLFHLTMEQAGVISSLNNRISVSIDQKTSVVTISVMMQDPVIAAQVGKVVLANLQSYITNYRTQKVKEDLKYTQKMYDEAKQRYYATQKAVAKFEDANRHISTSSYRTELERLNNEMKLTFGVYNTLAQKLEQDKLKVQEQTPIYAVIEPASVPMIPASPRKMMILVVFIFLGAVTGVLWTYLKKLKS